MNNNAKDMGLEARIEKLEGSLQYLKERMKNATEVTKAYAATDSSTTAPTYVDFETPIEEIGVTDFTVNFLKKRKVYTVGEAIAEVRSYEGTHCSSTELGCAKRVIDALTKLGFSIDNEAFLDYIKKYYESRLKLYIEKFLEQMQ